MDYHNTYGIRKFIIREEIQWPIVGVGFLILDKLEMLGDKMPSHWMKT